MDLTHAQTEPWAQSLMAYFAAGAKATASKKLGVEMEHFLLHRDTRQACAYFGPNGVREILQKLMACYPGAEILPDEDFFGFTTQDFHITLEPAAQLEISIEPEDDLARIGQIYQTFRAHLDGILEPLGLQAVNTGCEPVSHVDALPLIPKRRYALMDAYFQHTGTGGREMMRGTASLQVSIDYVSEADFREKIQAAYYYGPALRLFCDFAPSFQGVAQTRHLLRADIWHRVDPDRCGILPGIFSPDYGYADYVRFLSQMPPIFLKKDGVIEPTGEQTLAQLLAGQDLSEAEIEHVLSMAFPDVRLKRYLEIRFADCVPYPFVMAYCALIQGLLCHPEGVAYAQEQIRAKQLTERDVRQAENALIERGWDGTVYGAPVRDLAEHMLTMARRHLADCDAAYLNAFAQVMQCGGLVNIK